MRNYIYVINVIIIMLILLLLCLFSTFKHNRCPDGIVNIGYIPLILYGRNVFMSNRGPALRVSNDSTLVNTREAKGWYP